MWSNPWEGRGWPGAKLQGEKLSGGISKFITPKILQGLRESCPDAANAGSGLFAFFASERAGVAHACADAVRRHLGEKLQLAEEGYRCLWINDFPLLEYSPDDGRFYALHHPFTRPKDDDRELLLSGSGEELGAVRADAYDLVINGYEVAGGSMRIYQQDVQQRMFEVLGFSAAEAQSQFGFFSGGFAIRNPSPRGNRLWL